jgi:hypothetical protein
MYIVHTHYTTLGEGQGKEQMYLGKRRKGTKKEKEIKKMVN